MNTTMRQSIRTIILLLTLVCSAVTEAWAITVDNIKIDNQIVNGSITNATVADDGRTVTITVTPNSGYYIDRENIIVHKLLDPNNAYARTDFPTADALTVDGPQIAKEATNYTFVVPADYAGAFVTATFTALEPATAVITPNALTYNGEQQTLVTIGEITGGAVTFSLEENGTYTTAIPTGTDAGEYHVYYKIASNDTHSEGSGSVTVTIARAPLTDVTLDNSIKRHTGEPVTFNVEVVMAGELTVPESGYTVSDNEQTDIGNYTMTITGIGNYTGTLTTDIRIVEGTVIVINSSTDIPENPDMSATYVLAKNISFSALANLYNSDTPFTGEFDGGFHTISGVTQALFKKINAGKVKNVILSGVSISGGTYVGAIANETDGNTRIYNCGVKSGTISGTNAGSIVGKLDGYSRVINCYSFATVSGSTWSAGIVGYNCFSSTRSDLRTMVMNCMFYGEISSGTNISPIYGGLKITNVSNLNGYNYYRFDADYSRNNSITAYNCALAAEEKYLTRFEFFRNTLNSNRELAAWYATGDPNDGKGIGNACEMAKWVLDIAEKPYPILKAQDYYPSVINYEDAPTLGTISLTIDESNDKPEGASINQDYPTTLTVYDKDLAHNHFNYRTVRLPYYNEVGTGNCTKNKVVTGWKITGFTDGTQGHFVNNTLDYSGTTHGEGVYPPYNFADRYCTDKDKYSVSGRVFSQGAYYDVPEGVTGITIEPYWGTAVYLSDPTYDVAYPKGYGNNNANAVFVSNMGDRYVNGNTASINGDDQIVYTNYSSAFNKVSSSGTIYDNAIVLVGNYHHYWGQNSPSTDKAYTVMSADLNNDCEPDYSFIVQHGTGRQNISAIRFDFINSPGLGMIQKVETDKAIPKHGIWCPKGWFEVTNTTLIEFTQFEYDRGGKSAGSPLILLGGIYDQFITARQNVANSTEYIHLGSNIWMKEFCNGVHTNASNSHTTRHIPISVTGGEFESFYLTGTFRPSVTSVTDNAECYINGGKFGDMAGAGQEQLKGDVTWLIDHADITNFYGGGINGQKPVTGNIYVEINNSQVELYCGGPKFGNMQANMKVTTKAKGSTFGNFYGAGYGGTSYFRDMTQDATGGNDWDTWVGDYTRKYVAGKGISTEYECEFIPYSGGQSGQADYVGRFYVLYASLSLAETKDVESTLEDCHITGSFYGGGKLGRVDGDIISTLKNCTVGANVFGAGFSASVEKVKVVPLGTNMKENPSYNEKVGVFTEGIYPDGVEYTWTHATSVSEGSEFDDTNKYIYTTVDLNTLGVVTGDVKLNIEGSTVNGNVYGGGEESNVEGDTEVKMTNGTIGTSGLSDVDHGNVFGGGKGKADSFECSKAMVGIENSGIVNGVLQEGGTTVTITGGTVYRNVYGGGEVGRVEKNAKVTIGIENETGNKNAPIINGSVFGAGAGKETHGYSALLRGNTEVTIQGTALVGGSVFGGGEKASVGRFELDENKLPKKPLSGGYCTVTITDNAKIGSSGTDHDVFGAGQGVESNWTYTAADTYTGRLNNSKRMMTYTSSTVHPEGTKGTEWDYYVTEDGSTDERYVWEYYPSEPDYLAFLNTLALASHPTVIISENASVFGDVYGGGKRGITLGDVKVDITGGTVAQDVYGGGALADTNKGCWNGTGWADATEGSALYTTHVSLMGGTIGGDAYGGGLGQKESGTQGETGYVSPIEALVYGDVLVELNGKTTTENNTTTITQVADDAKGCIVNRIFGCNNENGTPKGKVQVHVYSTQKAGESTISNKTNTYDVEAVYGGGNLAAYVPVNSELEYNDTNKDILDNLHTTVIIDGCGLTSIKQVYGGGNAASTPATSVTINGTYEIEELFGGGNGKDDLPDGSPNPGANVGFKAYDVDDELWDTKDKRTDPNNTDFKPYIYGSGRAAVDIYGGKIHRVFGGSNTKGNVRITAVTMLEEKRNGQDKAICDFKVDEAYGGGKSAPMDAEAKLLMACIPGLEQAYGGAEAADIQGNVELNITNGKFNRVFGGNNISGTIRGSITVNIEETGCRPIIIGELYGGGNRAGYSIYGYKQVTEGTGNNAQKVWKPRISADDTGEVTDVLTTPFKNPEVNVKSFTSIGNIYGGGYGETAVMVGSPEVNINVAMGDKTTHPEAKIDTEGEITIKETVEGVETSHTVKYPSHQQGNIGAINNVFGGGNAAKVIGNTSVKIGTETDVYETVYFESDNIPTNVTGYYNRSGAGTSASPYSYSQTTTIVAGQTYYKKKTVIGADIRGNVYGGGNAAEVTGKSDVQIGRDGTQN